MPCAMPKVHFSVVAKNLVDSSCLESLFVSRGFFGIDIFGALIIFDLSFLQS